MNRFDYYQEVKAKAREVRAEFDLDSPRVLRSDLRRIFKAKGVEVDLWPPAGVRGKLRNLRGAFFNDDRGKSVMVSRSLPEDPRVFTMGHELKHCLCDTKLKMSYCDVSNTNDWIEIGAEVFAAELIFPDEDVEQWLSKMGMDGGTCTPEMIVRLKRESGTTLSHTGLAKKVEFLGHAEAGIFDGVRWRILEREVYGEPLYVKRRRVSVN